MQHILLSKSLYSECYNYYQNELVNFVEVLKSVHPGFLVDKNLLSSIDIRVEALLESLKDENSISQSDFQVMLNKLLVLLGDAHSLFQVETLNVFPLEFRYFEGEFWVYSISKRYLDVTGFVLQKINGVDIREIKLLLQKYIPAESQIKVGILGSVFLNNVSLLSALGILDDKENVVLTFKNAVELNVSLCAGGKGRRDKDVYIIKSEQHPVTYKRNLPFYYSIEGDICYLQFNSMFDRTSYKMGCEMMDSPINDAVYNRLPSFIEFLEGMYDDIRERNIEFLAIDLRNNGGGNSLLGDALLGSLGVDLKKIATYKTQTRISDLLIEFYPKMYEEFSVTDTLINAEEDSHLLEKCLSYFHIKKRYDKKVVFIQGQNTFSSANFLLTTIKDNKLFTIIGTPTSQKPTCYGDIIPIELPYTHSKGCISHSCFHRPDSSKDAEDSLFPDVLIETTVSDYLGGRDVCWDWVREWTLI